MFYPAKIICYCIIISYVKLHFSECISLTQEEHNIIASRPMKLVCNIGTTIANTVTVRSPDGVVVVSCLPTSTVPPVPADCSKTGDYIGSIDETANTVTVTTNILLDDVNGTWSCTHGADVANFDFPSPIPCLISENFDVNPSSTGNITSTTATFSLIATYSCINVDVTFKWILTASGTPSKEFISSSVTKDSAACTDSGTCTGVSAYTQTISSDSLFIFANAENLIGGYELSAEAVLSNGVTALKSHSIGYFEFSEHASTQKPTTQPPLDEKCFLGNIPQYGCVLMLISGIVVVLAIIISCCIYCRKDSIPDKKSSYYKSKPRNGLGYNENEGDGGISTQNGTEPNLESNDEIPPDHNRMHVNSSLRNIPDESENGEKEGISPQNGTESNLNSNNKTTNSAHKSGSSFESPIQNKPDKRACYENSKTAVDDKSKFDDAKDATTQV